MVAPAAPYDPQYEREDEVTLHRYELATGNTLRFAARDIRREKTGIHARVSISMNWVTLAWTNFNIERDEDRVRLANSAFKHLDDRSHELDRAEFGQNLFKHALDIFCDGLWDSWVGDLVGGQMAGDPNSPPARPLLGDYVLDQAGTILFAPPGEGKTYTALAWADCLLWGRETVWKLHDTQVPLYINVERSQVSMAGRLARVNNALGLAPETPMPFLNARGKSLSDIYEAAQRTIKKEGCKVVFYDSISRAGFGSLIQDDIANRIVDMLNALSPTWVALAHSPRGDEGHAFGSQMFDAAADVTVQLKSQTSKDGLTTGVGLQIAKANDIAKGTPMQVHVFEWTREGLQSIRRGRSGEFAELEAAQRKGLEEQVAELLESEGPMSGTQVADRLGRNRANISSLLNKGDRFIKLQRDGKETRYAVKTERVAQ